MSEFVNEVSVNYPVEKLVSIGCSHMYGSEIMGEGSPIRRQELTFAGLIAKHLGLEHEDLSVPGGSNTYIRETAVEHLAKNDDRQGTLYLIGWTTYSRHYFYWENEDGEEEIYHWAQGVDPGPASEVIGTDVSLLFDYFKLYMTNDDDGRRRRMTDTILLANTFKTYKVPYAMMSSCSTWIAQDFNEGHPRIGSHWKKHFPFPNYYEPYNAFVQKMIDQRPDCFTKSLHGNNVAHKNYAIGLRNFIKYNILRGNNRDE
tara:strand:- start:3932 stop:4705 length:774 start_codon:yes stop_codon:yes gene_type:complete